MLDLGFVRAQFPALRDDWALFDNAGGSVPLGSVIAAVADYMARWQVQLGASYWQSDTATRLVAEGHAAIARSIGADEGEVVISSSTTMNLRLLAAALRHTFRPGDEIVVSDLEHESNGGAWRALEADGVVLRTWEFDRDTQELTRAGLDRVLNARTRLVAFTHCSNIVGTIHDAAAFVRRIHEAGALACVDGVAFAPHRQVDVAAIGADFYAFSIYKVFGPHLGALYGRRALLEQAGSNNHFFIAADDVPYKLVPGGANHELTAALPAIGAYLTALDAHHGGGDDGARAQSGRAFARIAEHEALLAAPVLAFLRQHPRVRLLGLADPDPARRVPTIAFTVTGRHASEIPPLLDKENIAIRWGHFYAHRAVSALGLHEQGGVVRISMAHYNTPAEVARLLLALERVL